MKNQINHFSKLFFNYFKFLFFIFLITSTTGCEKEQVIINEQSSLLAQFENEFNYGAFSKALPYDFTVLWDNENKHYSNELGAYYYEFPVTYNSPLNPDNIFKASTTKTNKITYKIVVIENDNGKYDFYVAKFYQYIDYNYHIDNTISFEKSINYTGNIQLVDKKNNFVFISRIQNGSIRNIINLINKDLLKATQGDGCVQVPVEHYKDWYKVYEDPDGELHIEHTHIEFLGVTWEEKCYMSWLPTFTSFGTGEGEYKNNNGTLVYNIQDATVLVDDTIINNLTNPCAKTIFEDIREEGKQDELKPEVTIPNGETKTFSGAILDIFNNSSEYNYIITNGDIQSGYGALTVSNGTTITTTLSNSYLENATTLAIAATIIHEATHAYMEYKTDTDGDYETIMNNYYDQYGKIQGRSHHEFMIEYVNAMAYSIYTWDKNYGDGSGNLGWDYYYAMAFKGMFYRDSNNITRETDAFIDLIPDTNKRDEIIAILINEQKGNADAKGKKCN
jgi:hypothetical protein